MTFLITQLPPVLFNFHFYLILTKLGSYNTFRKLQHELQRKKKSQNVS